MKYTFYIEREFIERFIVCLQIRKTLAGFHCVINSSIYEITLKDEKEIKIGLSIKMITVSFLFFLKGSENRKFS